MDSTHRDPAQSAPANALDRRTFFGLAVTGVAAAAWPSLAFGQTFGQALKGDVPLSLGYLTGSDELADLRRAVWRRKAPQPGQASPSLPMPQVVPATSMVLGDQQLAGESVRVRIAGMYPRVPRRRDGLVSRADLTVDFTGLDPAFPEPRPFYAWGMNLGPAGRTTVSPPLRFEMPLGLDGGLRMFFQVTPATTLGLKISNGYTAATQFTVDAEPGMPRLQRGHYLIGLLPGVWDRARRLPAIDAPEAVELTSLVVSVEPIPKS